MRKFLCKTPPVAKLHVIRGAATTDCVSVPLPCLIGRGRGADLFVDSLLVSRNHCRLNLVDGKVFLIDLGSRNGTTVNDHLIPENISVELSNNSSFSIGPLTFQLEYQPTEVVRADGKNAVNSVNNLQLA